MNKHLFWSQSFLLLLILNATLLLGAPIPESLKDQPVQSHGRVKPFLSFANETLVSVTGKHDYEGRSASEVVWQWIVRPEEWETKPMIPVAFRPLRKEFGPMMVENHLTAQILLNHAPFLEKVQEAADKQRSKKTLSQIERERLALYERAAIFREIGMGEAPGWIANPSSSKAAWFSMRYLIHSEGLAELQTYFSKEKIEAVGIALRTVLEDLRESRDAKASADLFSQSIRALYEEKGVKIDEGVIQHEKIYHTLRPFGWCWKIYLMSFLFLISASWISSENIIKKTLFRTGLMSLAAGFLLHGYGFYLRCVIAGRPPVSNMYESIIWVSWSAVLFALMLFWSYRASVILSASALVGALALLIAEGFPTVLDPKISPLVPVLRSSLWLTVHVLTITLSYGAFALAWALGHVCVFGQAFKPEKRARNLMLAQFVYRALQIGVILLAVGTVLGGVWANYSWGRFWGWDPKETWALIALLGYLAVLHGRYAGWMGIFGLCVGAIYAFALVVMAWYGVNFVLAAGLHSYGFGGGGALYVLSFMLADMVITGALILKHRRNLRKGHQLGQ